MHAVSRARRLPTASVVKQLRPSSLATPQHVANQAAVDELPPDAFTEYWIIEPTGEVEGGLFPCACDVMETRRDVERLEELNARTKAVAASLAGTPLEQAQILEGLANELDGSLPGFFTIKNMYHEGHTAIVAADSFPEAEDLELLERLGHVTSMHLVKGSHLDRLLALGVYPARDHDLVCPIVISGVLVPWQEARLRCYYPRHDATLGVMCWWIPGVEYKGQALVMPVNPMTGGRHSRLPPCVSAAVGGGVDGGNHMGGHHRLQGFARTAHVAPVVPFTMPKPHVYRLRPRNYVFPDKADEEGGDDEGDGEQHPAEMDETAAAAAAAWEQYEQSGCLDALFSGSSSSSGDTMADDGSSSSGSDSDDDTDSDLMPEFEVEVADSLARGAADGGAPAGADDASSRFRGTFQQPNGLWRASITMGGNCFYLGLYRTPEQAACAFDRATLVYRGATAPQLNYPVGAYLHANQQLLIAQLRAQATDAAAAGSSVPRARGRMVLAEGEAGTAAIRAEAARQQAVAAAAGIVLQMPPEEALVAEAAAIRPYAYAAPGGLPAQAQQQQAQQQQAQRQQQPPQLLAMLLMAALRQSQQAPVQQELVRQQMALATHAQQQQQQHGLEALRLSGPLAAAAASGGSMTGAAPTPLATGMPWQQQQLVCQAGGNVTPSPPPEQQQQQQRASTRPQRQKPQPQPPPQQQSRKRARVALDAVAAAAAPISPDALQALMRRSQQRRGSGRPAGSSS